MAATQANCVYESVTMTVQPQDIRLLANPAFRRLLQSRLLGLTAQNALLYALLIIVVEKTGSSLYSTLLIASLTLPSIVFGIAGGTLADSIPKLPILIAGYLFRGLIVIALIIYGQDIWHLFLLAGVFAGVAQLFSPAESAALPAIVRPDQIAHANAMMVFSSMLSQLGGMVLLAPLLLRIRGEEPLYVVVAALFFAATWFVARIGAGLSPPRTAGASIGFFDAMRLGFQLIATNRRAYLGITYITITATLLKVLVVLLPQYTENVLHIATRDTVYVATPAAIGGGLGLLVTPLAARFLGAWRVAAFGFVLFLLGLAGLGLVFYVRDFLEANLDLGISLVEERIGVSSVITVTMILAIPLGFAYTAVSVAGRAVMNEEAPYHSQGRLFAVQLALADLLSLLPLVIVGGVAELVGVRATLLASVAAAVALATYLTFTKKIGPGAEEKKEQPLKKR